MPSVGGVTAAGGSERQAQPCLTYRTWSGLQETLPLLLRLKAMASVHSEPLSQRLAAIREQLKLLADYL